MNAAFEVTRINDHRFTYDVFYQKTETNSVVISAINRFIRDPNYECLREDYVPDLDNITKEYLLLILNPSDDQSFGSWYYRPRERGSRPYILISVHTGPLTDFESVFCFIGRAIVHEMLHELFDDEKVISEKLSEFDVQFTEQCRRDTFRNCATIAPAYIKKNSRRSYGSEKN